MASWSFSSSSDSPRPGQQRSRAAAIGISPSISVPSPSAHVHKQARRRSLAIDDCTPDGGDLVRSTVSSMGGMSFDDGSAGGFSQSSTGSSLQFSGGSSTPSPAQAGTFARPDQVTEYLCTTRLSVAMQLYAAGSTQAATVQRVLTAVGNIVAAEAWFAADGSRGSCPASLAGQQIGELEVEYRADLIGMQRRYAKGACIFALPKAARHAACYGLYVDGDLVASELVALQHACKVDGIRSDALDAHLANREQQLAALGDSCCDGSRVNASQRRDFGKRWVNAVIHGASVRPAALGEPPNAVSKLFEDYGVLPTAQPPAWLMALAREMQRVGRQIVEMSDHCGIDVMDGLRNHPDADKRAKVRRSLPSLCP